MDRGKHIKNGPGDPADRGLGSSGERGWRIAFLVACTVGICLSLDLLRLHVRVHNDPDYQSYCAISEYVNCESEALSSWSVFVGMPVAAWGLLGYLVMAALAIWGLRSRNATRTWPFALNLALSAFSSLVAVWFGFVSVAIIESICIVCVGTYLVSFSLFAFSWRVVRRCGLTPRAALLEELATIRAAPRGFALFAAVGVAVLAGVWAGIPDYWTLQRPPTASTLPAGDTADGHAWIGATTPVLEVTEFSDYQCPFCQRGHEHIRQLIDQHPDEIRLIHVHFPLDLSCNATMTRQMHPNACLYARLAYCAQQQGKFWDVNDYLFANGRRRTAVTVDEVAEESGLRRDVLAACVKSNAAERAIAADLELGRSLGIRGTPTFVIDKKAYVGGIPAEVLDRALVRRVRSPDPP
jgi:predicted DsbA family dithiol-disulfide isomerase/uncharacterized membrane protein